MRSKINYYSAKRLYENGIEQDGMLVCNKIVSDYSLIAVNDREDCHLFDQTRKALGANIDLNKVFIILDFKDVSKVLVFKPFINGIKLVIKGEEHVFVDYLKSNSMNKNCCMYYINKEYYETIDERINFGFNNVTQVPLSKWYAYSGLSISDCHILNNINLSIDEICIIDDKKTKKEVDCITAVSLPILLKLLQDYKEKIELFKKSNTYLRMLDDSYLSDVITLSDCDLSSFISSLDKEIECYKGSSDFDNLPDEIRNCIDDIINLKDVDMEEIIDYIDDKIYEYEQLLSENTISWHKIRVTDFPVEINHFDGEGLVSLELAEQINQSLRGTKKYKNEEDEENDEENSDYEESNSFQIRLPFMKGIIHSCDFKQFFKEKGITQIKGFNSYNNKQKTRMYNVDKLKIILTKSQFKALSFMKHLNFTLEDYFNLLEKHDYHLGISGVEPLHKKEVRLCYQFLSTLPINNSDFDNIINRNINNLKEDITEEKIINHLRIIDSDSYPMGLDIYEKNPKFYKSSILYKRAKEEMFHKGVNNFAVGRLYVNGVRKYLCSDLLSILYHSIDKIMSKKDELKLDSFYSPQTKLLDNCIILRNPHYSRNEITVMKNNNTNDEREKYFGHLTGVIMFNPTSLSADRLGGADYDGDEVCIVNDKEMIDVVKPGILTKSNEHIYPLVKIPSVSYQPIIMDELPYHRRLKSLDATFSNRTGIISNIAFEKTLDVYQNNDVHKYEDIGFFTVFGGLEIDSCKNGKKPKLPFNLVTLNEFIKVKDVLLGRKKEERGFINSCIQTIDKAYESNLVYYNFYKNISQKTPKEEESYKFNNPNASIDDNYLKSFAITKAFNCFDFALDSFQEENKEHTKNKQHIIKQLNLIFSQNDIILNINNLLNKFKMNAFNNFYKYLDKTIMPYHFLTKYEDKINFIKEILSISKLSDSELKALTTFNNGGYKVLYLILYYNYLLDEKTMLLSKIKYKYETRLKTTESNKEIIDAYYNKYIKYVIDLVESKMDIRLIRRKFIEYLKGEAKDLPYQTVVSVDNPLNSKLSFNIFKKQVVEYLDKEEEQNE